MNFDQCVTKVLKFEGGYSNHPSDRGAATNYGITQRTYTMWRNAKELGYRDVRDIKVSEARLIYLDNYWIPARCDDLPDEIRDIHFDAAVNHGVKRAAILLQQACHAEQDGKIGHITISLANTMAPSLLRARYIAARYRFYGEIVARDRTQLVFLVGWLNRMAEFNA